MHHIRPEILQHTPHLPFRLPGIDDPEGIKQLCHSAGMEIHIRRITLQTVSHDPPCMFHAEILYLMPFFLQLFPQLKDIRLRSAIRIKELIYHQYLHHLLQPSSLKYADCPDQTFADMPDTSDSLHSILPAALPVNFCRLLHDFIPVILPADKIRTPAAACMYNFRMLQHIRHLLLQILHVALPEYQRLLLHDLRIFTDIADKAAVPVAHRL